MNKMRQKVADVGLMLETALGYLSRTSNKDAKKAEHHIEVAQRMLHDLL